MHNIATLNYLFNNIPIYVIIAATIFL